MSEEQKENQKDNQKEVKKEATTKENKIKLRNLLVLITIIVFTIVAYVALKAEYLSVKEVGENYVTVFEQNLRNKLNVGLAVFIIVYIITYISNMFIKKGLKNFFEDEKKDMPKLPNKSTAFILALVACGLCMVFLTEKYSIWQKEQSLEKKI